MESTIAVAPGDAALTRVRRALWMVFRRQSIYNLSQSDRWVMGPIIGGSPETVYQPSTPRAARSAGSFTRYVVATSALLWLAPSMAADPPVPLESGIYEFRWKDAEFPNSAGFPVKVIIDGDRVSVLNEHQGGAAPLGEIESATLMWHAKLSKWVLGHSESARTAPEAGDCSGEGPHVIDFEARVIWTCEWGP